MITAVICSGVKTTDEEDADTSGSGAEETSSTEVVVVEASSAVVDGSGGGRVVDGREPNISDTRLIGFRILLGLLRRL